MNEKRLNERENSGLEPTLNTSQLQLIFDFVCLVCLPFHPLWHTGFRLRGILKKCLSCQL